MDWDRVIAINKAALTRIVANLIAVVGLATRGSPIYRGVLLILLPAESAVRRLIIIAARTITVTLAQPRPSRPMAKGPVQAGTRQPRQSFPLFDSRKRFDARPWGAGPKAIPRVRFVDADPPLVPLFQKTGPAPEPEQKTLSTVRLNRRLETLRLALETLPRQAMRMARWRARRALMQSPKFTSPLRPGPPPGHRKKSRDPVDEVLKDCHALAFEVLKANSS